MNLPEFNVSGEDNHIDLGKNIELSGWIIGNNNRIVIGAAHRPHKIYVQMHGEGNSVVIGANPILNGLRVEFGNKKYQTWNASLEIGDGFSVASRGRFLLPNPNNIIRIGDRCMFSNEVVLRGGEYPHLVFDDATGEYLDRSDGIFIGNHVWLGEGAYVNKAVTIPDDCIVGARSVVTKRFKETKTVIAGNPARVVKQGVSWVGNESQIQVPEQRESVKRARKRPKRSEPPISGG